jgi:hypothetical protein
VLSSIPFLVPRVRASWGKGAMRHRGDVRAYR